MYQAKSGVKKFFPLLGRGGGSLYKNFFFKSEHVSSQIWCQKFFPLLVRGGPLNKNFFFQSEHVSKPNLVSKFFPFTETRYPPPPDLRPGIPPPPDLRPGPPPDLRPPHLDLDTPHSPESVDRLKI